MQLKVYTNRRTNELQIPREVFLKAFAEVETVGMVASPGMLIIQKYNASRHEQKYIISKRNRGTATIGINDRLSRIIGLPKGSKAETADFCAINGELVLFFEQQPLVQIVEVLHNINYGNYIKIYNNFMPKGVTKSRVNFINGEIIIDKNGLYPIIKYSKNFYLITTRTNVKHGLLVNNKFPWDKGARLELIQHNDKITFKQLTEHKICQYRKYLYNEEK